MDRPTRHEALLSMLRRNTMATVDQLAASVGVSRRTILRDIGAMREQGFLIETEPGPGGGVRLDPGSMQTTARLTVSEIFALLLGVAALRAAQTLPFANLADAGLAKLEKSLPSEKIKDLRALLGRLYIGKVSPCQDLSDVRAVDSALLRVFEQAFLQRQQLSFEYHAANGARTRRNVEPQAMLVLPPLWYLVAWDPSRSDFRHFRMDRISFPRTVEGAPFRLRHVPFNDDVCPFRDSRC